MAFSPITTLIAFLSLSILIPILIAAGKWWVGRFADPNHQATPPTGKYSKLKKYPWVDVLRHTTTTRLLGLAFSLSFIVVLMNFTVYEKPVQQEVYTLIVDEEIEIAPPRTKEPPPPPPPPAPPVISEVPDEEIIEEDQPIFEDQSIEEETVFEEVKYKAPVAPEEEAAPPPPPPPPPPEESDVAEIFKVVEKMPLFGGCEDRACSDRAVMLYIQQNIRYPKIASENGITGRVIIQFVVEPDGRVTNVQTVRDIGGGCGDAAVEVIKNMNNLSKGWTPGEQRGQPVRVLYTLPAKFELQS